MNILRFQIETITGAELNKIDSRFARKGLANFEVHITEDTVMSFHGKFEASDDDPKQAKDVNFHNIEEENGLIRRFNFDFL